jgi:hypothetical protein
VREKMTFHFASRVGEVLEFALEPAGAKSQAAWPSRPRLTDVRHQDAGREASAEGLRTACERGSPHIGARWEEPASTMMGFPVVLLTTKGEVGPGRTATLGGFSTGMTRGSSSPRRWSG